MTRTHYILTTQLMLSIFRKVTNIFNLELSMPINQVPTKYANNPSESNLVIDLMFLQVNSKEIDTHIILQDL